MSTEDLFVTEEWWRRTHFLNEPYQVNREWYIVAIGPNGEVIAESPEYGPIIDDRAELNTDELIETGELSREEHIFARIMSGEDVEITYKPE